MSMKGIVAMVAVLALIACPVYAGQEGKGKGCTEKHGQAETAGDKIANETADAVANVLTGEESKPQPSDKGMPPGLAKKDKTPPGWDEGKKTGWNKGETAFQHKDSPIDKFIKGLFGVKEKKGE